MKITRIKIILVIAAFLLLTACTNQQVAPAGNIDTPTLTMVPTETLAPTSTPQPTSTSTPQPTPTLSFPVKNMTPIPTLNLPSINMENSSQLVEIARYGNTRAFGCMQLSDDSNIMVSADVAGIDLIEWETGQVSRVVDADLFSESYYIEINGMGKGVGASADGMYLTGFTADRQVAIWNQEGEQLFLYDMAWFDLSDWFNKPSFSLSPDGKLLAVPDCEDPMILNTCSVQVIDWKKNEVVVSLKGTSGTFSPGGKFILVVFDGKTYFYKVEDWSEVHIEMLRDGIIKVSPQDNYYVLINRSSVQIYDTTRFLSSVSISDYEPGVYEPEVLISQDEKIIHLLIFDRRKTTVSTFDFKTGYWLSEVELDYSTDWQICGVDENDEVLIKVYEKKEQGIDFATFTESPLREAGIKEVLSQENPNQYWKQYWKNSHLLLSSGQVIDYWNDELIFYGRGVEELETRAFDDLYYAMFNLTTEQLLEIEVKDDVEIRGLNGGSKWGVLNVGDHDAWSARFIVFDSETDEIIADRTMPSAYRQLYFPLEYWHGLGAVNFIDGCTDFISLAEEKGEPVQLCIPLIPFGEGYFGKDETLEDIATTLMGKLAAFSTSAGNIYFVDMETGEIKKVHLQDSIINNIAFSSDGSLLSTYSDLDYGGNGYNRVWGVMQIPEE